MTRTLPDDLKAVYSQAPQTRIFEVLGVYHKDLVFDGQDPNYPGWFFGINDKDSRMLRPLVDTDPNLPQTEVPPIPFKALPPTAGETQQKIKITLPLLSYEVMSKIETLQGALTIGYFVFLEISDKPQLTFVDLKSEVITIDKLSITIEASKVDLFKRQIFTDKYDLRFKGLWL